MSLVNNFKMLITMLKCKLPRTRQNKAVQHNHNKLPASCWQHSRVIKKWRPHPYNKFSTPTFCSARFQKRETVVFPRALVKYPDVCG